MSVFDRLGKVVRAELSALRGHSTPPHPADATGTSTPAKTTRTKPTTTHGRSDATRPPMVTDVEQAKRVLELHGEPTLAEVRARAHALSRHFHPKTCSSRPDEAETARAVLEGLTEALEILEEHLLPTSPVPPTTPPTDIVEPRSH
jgi:hypothetical protein